jgi:hypothetical protein
LVLLRKSKEKAARSGDDSVFSTILAGTEGANANTLPLDFEVTDSLIQSMIELTRGMRKLGIRDVNGTLTYEEDNL